MFLHSILNLSVSFLKYSNHNTLYYGARIVTPLKISRSCFNMPRYLNQTEAIRIDEELFSSYGFGIEQLMELAGLRYFFLKVDSYHIYLSRFIRIVAHPQLLIISQKLKTIKKFWSCVDLEIMEGMDWFVLAI